VVSIPQRDGAIATQHERPRCFGQVYALFRRSFRMLWGFVMPRQAPLFARAVVLTFQFASFSNFGFPKNSIAAIVLIPLVGTGVGPPNDSGAE
jgi:hypothetical protein